MDKGGGKDATRRWVYPGGDQYESGQSVFNKTKQNKTCLSGEFPMPHWRVSHA